MFYIIKSFKHWVTKSGYRRAFCWFCFILSFNLLYIRYSKFLKCLVLDMEYTRGHQVRSHGHWGIVLWRLTEWSCVYYHHRLYSYYVHNILDTNKIQYHSNIHRCLVAFNILILSGLASGIWQHNTTGSEPYDWPFTHNKGHNPWQ